MYNNSNEKTNGLIKLLYQLFLMKIQYDTQQQTTTTELQAPDRYIHTDSCRVKHVYGEIPTIPLNWGSGVTDHIKND